MFILPNKKDLFNMKQLSLISNSEKKSIRMNNLEQKQL